MNISFTQSIVISIVGLNNRIDQAASSGFHFPSIHMRMSQLFVRRAGGCAYLKLSLVFISRHKVVFHSSFFSSSGVDRRITGNVCKKSPESKCNYICKWSDVSTQMMQYSVKCIERFFVVDLIFFISAILLL